MSQTEVGPRHACVLPAGGAGVRMGGPLPKQFLQLDGAPVICHAIRAFHLFDSSVVFAVALSPDYRAYWAEQVAPKLPAGVRVLQAEGGATRTASVFAALRALHDNYTENTLSGLLVAVHDAARPLVQPATIAGAYASAGEFGAAVCAQPLAFSLRKGAPDGGTLAVPREDYYEVQTPQAFRWDVLWPAYAALHEYIYTDDASLVEAAGVRPAICPGAPDNLKLTWPHDLPTASAILAARKKPGRPL